VPTFAPLSAGFGLESRDVDLARLDDATFAEVERAFESHLLYP